MKNYRKVNEQPMRPYIVGEDLTGISVSAEDTPEEGGMIAVNPNNSQDQWYIAKTFFESNYEEVIIAPPSPPLPEKSIYDLITVAVEDDGTAILEDIKPISEIYEELTSSNVTAQLSFVGGIKLSHILNKLQTAIATNEGVEEETPGVLDSVLSDSERSYLYGVYLIR